MRTLTRKTLHMLQWSRRLVAVVGTGEAKQVRRSIGQGMAACLHAHSAELGACSVRCVVGAVWSAVCITTAKDCCALPTAAAALHEPGHVDYPVNVFSVTIAIKLEDVPTFYLRIALEFMHLFCLAGLFAYERGGRHGRGHLQGQGCKSTYHEVLTMRCLSTCTG